MKTGTIINVEKTIIALAAVSLLMLPTCCHPSKTEPRGTEGNTDASIAEEEDSLF